MSDDLVTWLRAQLDDDEATTRALLYWAQQTILTLQDPRLLGKHIPGWHDWPKVERMCSARLAEVDAKRRILDEVVDEATGLDIQVDNEFRVGTRDTAAEPYLGDVLLRLLALPYAAQPGYRPEWAPTSAPA